MGKITNFFAQICAQGLIAFASLLTGVRSFWVGCAPATRKRIYFANHSSHADFVMLWSSLPPELRKVTRPVAAAKYWSSTWLRRFVIHEMFNGVLVQRGGGSDNPLEPLFEAVKQGYSLIFFPEGTRNMGDGLLPFKSGLYHLAAGSEDVEFVPVWIDNLQRVLPKGKILPLPILCNVRFGTPLHLDLGEDKDAFLQRARAALLKLQPGEDE